MTEIAVLSVEGMHCQACVARVEKALSSLPGVSAVEVSLERNQARATYEPSRARTADLVKAIEEAGYKAGPAGDDSAGGR